MTGRLPRYMAIYFFQPLYKEVMVVYSYLYCLLFSSVLVLVAGQLPLPSPQYLPPDISSGALETKSQIPNTQWSNLLGNLLYFYEAQRSGKLPATNRVLWRNDSALNDGSDIGLDLSGGYYDAGDYIKATFPLTFALSSVCHSALYSGKGYDISNQTAYLDSMLRWGLDWLIKAHPSPSTLVVLVGNTDVDDAYWGGDTAIPGPRPSYSVNDTNPGTDVVASTAAAFAVCSVLYASNTSSFWLSAPSLQNATYADVLLSHARDLYTFAVNATGGQCLYQTSVPAVATSYASSSFGDDLAYAALCLSLATNSSSYYQDAISYFNQFSLAGANNPLNWDNRTPALAVLATQLALNGVNSDLGKWRSEAERFFDNIINKGGPGFLTHGGLLYYDGVSDDSSLNAALNIGALMAIYGPMATSSTKNDTYTAYANRQLNYAIGQNPMSIPYVVGSNPNSPQNPHSALASGGNDSGNIDTVPPQETYILYGALVGGPDILDRYFDIRSDWPETEPALDINAPILSLAAWHTLTDPNDPFYTSLQAGAYAAHKPSGYPCDDAFPCNLELSNGAKIAMSVTVAVTGLIVVLPAFYWIFLVLYRKLSSIK